jgi:hypothetical protein
VKTAALVFAAAFVANMFAEKVTDALNIDSSGMADELVAAGVTAAAFLVARKFLN